MKSFLTLLFACFTVVLSAQNVTFEPAQSLMNENATASLNGAFSSNEESPELEEVENHFDIKLSSNPYFEDITINYNLATTTDVTVEVLKGGKPVFVATKNMGSGQQETIWEKDTIGSGVHTIRITANNKVESKRFSL